MMILPKESEVASSDTETTRHWPASWLGLS